MLVPINACLRAIISMLDMEAVQSSAAAASSGTYNKNEIVMFS